MRPSTSTPGAFAGIATVPLQDVPDLRVVPVHPAAAVGAADLGADAPRAILQVTARRLFGLGDPVPA